jgi:hypothetical protein
MNNVIYIMLIFRRIRISVVLCNNNSCVCPAFATPVANKISFRLRSQVNAYMFDFQIYCRETSSSFGFLILVLKKHIYDFLKKRPENFEGYANGSSGMEKGFLM